jgi:hypothetical protein
MFVSHSGTGGVGWKRWSRGGTWSSLLPGYRRAVAATRLVGADPRVLVGVGGALGAASYLGTGGLLLLPVL